MKYLILATLLASQTALATPSEAKKLHCESMANDYYQLTLDAARVYVEDEGIQLYKVEAQIQFTDVDALEVGKKDYLESDTNYNPSKYKNHYRIQLDKLVDTRTFGRYLPGDTCSIKVMIPESIQKQDSFKAPVTINCDQSGGKLVLKCEVE